MPSLAHWRTRSGVHTNGRFRGHEGNRTCEAMFTDTGRSGRLTASDNALRKVARIRCLVDSEITRRPRTEARTLTSSDSRHSRMWLLVSSMAANIASTWRAWSLSTRSRPRRRPPAVGDGPPVPGAGEAARRSRPDQASGAPGSTGSQTRMAVGPRSAHRW